MEVVLVDEPGSSRRAMRQQGGGGTVRRTMTTPIVTEQPLRLAPVDRDTFCERPERFEWTPPRRRPDDA